MNSIVNTNLKTGIRFGVIACNDINPDFLAEFDAVYPDVYCSNCGEKLNDIYCDNCETENYEYQNQDPIGHIYNKNGIKAQIDSDFIYCMVFQSPAIFKCRLCSPCFPNAGDLNTKGQYSTYGIPTKYLVDNFKRD